MMNPFFDPSKMDPKVLMELSSLVRQLPPEQLNRMQTLMHNMMAGHNVQGEMEEFERSLPAEFRQKLAGLMMSSQAIEVPRGGTTSAAPEPTGSDAEMNLREARMTVLRAVSDGDMTPEEAERILFAAG